MKYFSIDTHRGNCIYVKNAVRSSEDYTAEEMAVLESGGEIPVVFDDDGEPIEWESMSLYDDEE